MKLRFFIPAVVLVFFFITSSIHAQRKISGGVYMYGDISGQIVDNVCVFFEGMDPGMENKLLKQFEKHGIPVVSFSNYIIPGTEITEEKLLDLFQEKNINTFIKVKLTDVTETRTHETVTDVGVASDGSSVYGQSRTYDQSTRFTLSVRLQLSVFSSKNDFQEQVAMIYSDVTGNWGEFSTVNSVSKRSLKKILKGLAKVR